MNETRSGGIGLGGLLFVVFLVLKLTHVIAWSWVWVFAPLWIPLAVLVVVGFTILMFAVAAAIIEKGEK